MVKENNKTNILVKKTNNFSLIKYEHNVIKSYYLYLSINRFSIDEKTYCKLDYVLNNNKIDLIPNKNIFNKNEISSIYTLKFKNNNIYIYNTPNIKLFSYLDLFDYKVKTAIIEIEDNENLFVKFFNEKKLFIKNDKMVVEQIKPNINNDLDLLNNIFLEKLSIE